MGWKFGQALAGVASLCSTMSGASAWRIPRLGGGSQLRPGITKAGSCPWLATDGALYWGCGLERPLHVLDSLTAWQPQDFFHVGIKLQSGSRIAFYGRALKVTPCHKPAQIQREGYKLHLLVTVQRSMWDGRYCYCHVWKIQTAVVGVWERLVAQLELTLTTTATTTVAGLMHTEHLWWARS